MPSSRPTPRPRWPSTASAGRPRRGCGSAPPPCAAPSGAWPGREKKTLAAAEQDPAARAAWWALIGPHAPDRFVFLDETSSNAGLTPRSAWAPTGQRAHGQAPRTWGPTTTLVAALTPQGLSAAMTLEGALDSDAVAADVRHVLVPTLRPGQIVVCDNLSVHTRADIRALIEAAGCELWFLPASSPDFNPIEPIVGTVKAHLRRLAARTQAALAAGIGEALATVTPQDARNCFRHCGYHLTDQPS